MIQSRFKLNFQDINKSFTCNAFFSEGGGWGGLKKRVGRGA